MSGDPGKEETGSQSYIPPDEKDDKALKMAEDLLRGTVQEFGLPAERHQDAGSELSLTGISGSIRGAALRGRPVRFQGALTELQESPAC